MFRVVKSLHVPETGVVELKRCRCRHLTRPLSPHTADMTLKQQLGDRRHRAEERSLALKHANDFLDDDGIMERIFNSLTGQSASDLMACQPYSLERVTYARSFV